MRVGGISGVNGIDGVREGVFVRGRSVGQSVVAGIGVGAGKGPRCSISVEV